MLKNRLIQVRIFGVVLALLLFALPYDFCIDGVGYGFPFAWLHPGHGEWGTYPINPSEKFSDVIDIANIAISFAAWEPLNKFRQL